MENGGLATSKTIAFAKGIDENYVEFNPEMRDYMRSDDLFVFAALIDPELENIVVSSAFEHGVSFSYVKTYDVNEDYKQIEHYAYLFFMAVRYRKDKGLPCLNFHINYLYDDFLGHLKDGTLGNDTTTYVKLMLRQSEGFAKLFIYDEYKLQVVLNTEDDLLL